ncbi:MAG: CpsD/CapB family tyrosine-protein kinase [Pyrinomonadaceae bacterium]
MGRVYEALKRAADQSSGAKHNGAESSDKVSEEEMTTVHPESLLQYSSLFSSAPTAHTEGLVGSALPDEQGLRAAGATLGAVAPARAADFDSVEISVARVEPHLIAITQPQSAQAELYRSLRTSIIRAQEVRRMQTFLVTSAGPAEGKTVTSLNLSWLLAQTDGVKALLIEGDLRRPCMAEYLGVNGALGLADVLAGDVSLSDAIVKLQPSGLHLLPGGTPRENVAEILSGNKAESLLMEAREMFNYIIIDAPPLGVFADASVLMNRVDGALLVVRSGQTRYSLLDQLLAPLQREKILGVVLNGAEESLDNSHYYHSYYKRSEDAASSIPHVASREEIHAS